MSRHALTLLREVKERIRTLPKGRRLRFVCALIKAINEAQEEADAYGTCPPAERRAHAPKPDLQG